MYISLPIKTPLYRDKRHFIFHPSQQHLPSLSGKLKVMLYSVITTLNVVITEYSITLSLPNFYAYGNRSIIDLKKTSCYDGMHFGNFRIYSVKIGNLRKFRILLENAGCIPSAVIIMTTADGIHPVFSGRHPKPF